MSKKLAGGADCIVLDVKCGSGAFMKTEEDARKLASAMVDIGKRAGKRVAAVLTDMDLPLGTAVGNAVEVQEAVEVLRGKGPDDLRQVSLVLASTLLQLAGKGDKTQCETLAEDALQSGRALQAFERMVKSQGGDVCCIRDPSRFPNAKHSAVLPAPQGGYLTAMDAEAIGRVCVLLGAGRRTKEDVIDPAAGLLIHKKTGDRVAAGEPLCTLLCEDEAKPPAAMEAYRRALTFGDAPPKAIPLILDIIE
jgi:pyrimidine-nucleoside phosphorylase